MKIYKIKVNGKTYKVELEAMEEVASKAEPAKAAAPAAAATPAPQASGEGQKVLSPIQGNVVAVKVNVGDKVKRGQVVAVVEAMKLENDIVSNFDGEVTQVLVSKGQQIAAKDAIVVVK